MLHLALGLPSQGHGHVKMSPEKCYKDDQGSGLFYLTSYVTPPGDFRVSLPTRNILLSYDLFVFHFHFYSASIFKAVNSSLTQSPAVKCL